MGKQGGGRSGDADISGLEEVIGELRAEAPVRRAWREDVLSEVQALARADRRAESGARRWTISPPTAIAAALAFTALGAAAAAGVYSLRDSDTQTIVTRLPEAAAPPSALRPPPVRFALVAPGASRVSLVGDFNRWDAQATPMRQLGDGRLWLVEVPLPPGRHVYAFVVDGDVTPDPAAPRAGEEDFGTPSSVVLVGARGS
jgi:Carbohydrate-binding module 48 (Isoamylase N-terminal domain)